MPAEASALGIALRRVGDDLAVVRLRRQRYSPRKP
jgi:hypothetical protein